MPVGHELLIIALNGDSLAAGSTAHYPVTILNHRHKQPESCVCACTHLHAHTHRSRGRDLCPVAIHFSVYSNC